MLKKSNTGKLNEVKQNRKHLSRSNEIKVYWIIKNITKVNLNIILKTMSYTLKDVNNSLK